MNVWASLVPNLSFLFLYLIHSKPQFGKYRSCKFSFYLRKLNSSVFYCSKCE